MRRRCASRSECKRDDDAGENREQPEAAPGGDQRRDLAPLRRPARALRRSEPIDDAAEQQRFGELREGDRDVGGDERQARDAARPPIGRARGRRVLGSAWIAAFTIANRLRRVRPTSELGHRSVADQSREQRARLLRYETCRGRPIPRYH